MTKELTGREKFRPFDAARYLTAPKRQAAYLAAALETEDEAYIKLALLTLARAQGMSKTARAANVSRQGLYKSLSATSDPKLSTVLAVFQALGVQLTVRSTGDSGVADDPVTG